MPIGYNQAFVFRKVVIANRLIVVETSLKLGRTRAASRNCTGPQSLAEVRARDRVDLHADDVAIIGRWNLQKLPRV